MTSISCLSQRVFGYQNGYFRACRTGLDQLVLNSFARGSDVSLFETLSSINERSPKLQDTLGAALRHGTMLAGEPGETFLKVLSFYEKVGIIESIESWQLCRTTRNLAAHDYGIDYFQIADHFNALHDLVPVLYSSAGRFVRYCQENLGIVPARGDFAESFIGITQKNRPEHPENPVNPI